jgi:hypothetical protein
VTASQAKRVIDLFRSGVLYENEADLQRALRFPVTVNMHPLNRREGKDYQGAKCEELARLPKNQF